MRTAWVQDKDKWKERGLAALCILGLWAVLAVCFDFYYDLNDDGSMKDILSGAYTGLPDGHNIQMLYPLGLCIALLYRLLPTVPWYGIFLCGCQFLMLWAISCSLLERGRDRWQKAVLLLSVCGGFVLLLYEFVFIQYTVTAGLLVCAGLIRLWCGPGVEEKGFYRYHIVTALLFVLAFYLRTEMMLLLSPFLGLAVLFLCRDEGNGSRAVKSYGCMILLTGALMGLGLLADHAAYGSPEWKEFRQFFDDRTQVYDFYGLPDYEADRELYDSLGMTKSSWTLLDNYNFELDEDIDAKAMHEIALYAASHRDISPARRLYLSVYTYVYRFTHGQELLFDLFAVFSYFFLVKAALLRKQYRFLGRIALLLGLRTALWLFLLYRGRVPERITHPLYLTELAMLGLLFLSGNRVFRWKKYEKSAILSLYLLLLLCTVIFRIQTVREEFAAREERNAQWDTWKAYCRERPEDFYYLDVYSTVAYSEKLFADTSPAYRNFDLLGGWCVKSPAALAKRKLAGCGNAQEDLLAGRAYFVTDGTKAERRPDFLLSYYGEKGTEISLEEADRCGDFMIYHVKADKEAKS